MDQELHTGCPKGCHTVLIDDMPTDHDDFGSHKKIAEAILELVCNEDGGKSIALTGSWGSGKSSVVTILSQMTHSCINDKAINTCVFVFDAWAHERDPLRRSFLEQLISFLSDDIHNWINKDDWSGVKEEIALRRKESTRVETLHPTISASLFGLAILLTPIGLLMAKPMSDEKNGLLTLIIGIILSLAPLILLGILWVCTPKFLNTLSKGIDESRKSLLSLLVSKGQTITKNASIETPDPTTVEFQAYFKMILGKALAIPERRLIVVIDNLYGLCDLMQPASSRG